jgi:hypothetical protein
MLVSAYLRQSGGHLPEFGWVTACRGAAHAHAALQSPDTVIDDIYRYGFLDKLTQASKECVECGEPDVGGWHHAHFVWRSTRRQQRRVTLTVPHLKYTSHTLTHIICSAGKRLQQR